MSFYLFCSKFDLYSKSDSVPDVEAVSPYYEELIAKYCPGELSWWRDCIIKNWVHRYTEMHRLQMMYNNYIQLYCAYVILLDFIF